MIIKICGMREADNIRDVIELGIDWLGLDFRPDSERLVRQAPSNAGFIPDRARPGYNHGKQTKLCGVFADDMPQNIVTRVVNYNLDLVQLNGNENDVMIDNLRSTLVPDIRHDVSIMKTLDIGCAAHFNRCKPYLGHADYFLFRLYGPFALLEEYPETTPFLVQVSSPEDIAAVTLLRHSAFLGVDLNEGFETAPAMKNIPQLSQLVSTIRKNTASQ